MKNPEATAAEDAAKAKNELDEGIKIMRAIAGEAGKRFEALGNGVANATEAVQRGAANFVDKTGNKFVPGFLNMMSQAQKRMNPLSGRFDTMMENGNLTGAAKEMMEMRQTLARRNENILPTAAARGSAEAEATISRSIAATMGGKTASEDVLKQIKDIESEQKRQLDKVIDELKLMNQRKVNVVNFSS